MNKVGLVLGGGGAKGSYQIGVLKALEEYNLLKNVNVISGASIGALNSCLVMGKMNHDERLKVWESIDNDNLYFQGLNRFKEDKLGLFDQTLMYKILTEFQTPESVYESHIKGYAAVTKIEDVGLRTQLRRENMEAELICLNEIEDPHKAVLASASVPVVFGPTTIDDEHYVDGGLLNNLPVDIMVKEGCNVIFVVGLKPGYDLNEYGSKALVIDLSPLRYLAISILGMLNFSTDAMHKRIDYGYKVAKNMLEELINYKIIDNHRCNTNYKGVYRLGKDFRLSLQCEV